MENAEYYKMADVEDRMWYYRSLHGYLERILAQRFASRACDLLDAGCGTGGLIRHLQSSLPAARITGIDLSPIACKLARQRTRVSIVEGRKSSRPARATRNWTTPVPPYASSGAVCARAAGRW